MTCKKLEKPKSYSTKTDRHKKAQLVRLGFTRKLRGVSPSFLALRVGRFPRFTSLVNVISDIALQPCSRCAIMFTH